MIESPCVRQCCLDDNDVCVGCFRHIDEICGWQSKTDEQKQAILEQCKSRKQTNREQKN